VTATYSAWGREEQARHQAQELLRLDRAFSLDNYAETVLNMVQDKVKAEQYIDNLRKMGMK